LTSIVVDPLVAVPNFVYRTVPQRIVFGAGTRHGIAEAAQLAGIDRAMVISTPEQASSANELAELLGNRCRVRFPGARMHTPVSITEAAVALAAQHDVDGLISVGGGLLGIAFGFFLAWLIARTAEWKTIVTSSSVIIAFGVSVAVGMIFGIYPAVKASRINPIDALRYE